MGPNLTFAFELVAAVVAVLDVVAGARQRQTLRVALAAKFVALASS